MSKSWSDEAIVLRTYNVGEADRFCILLTKTRGRLAARAAGVRRIASRRAPGLLTFHRIAITCDTHSFGEVITSSVCLDPHQSSWSTPHAFSAAEQGIELLLRFTDDGDPLSDVYALACDFLSACGTVHTDQLFSLFTLKLLRLLGFCPSFTHSSMSHAPFQRGDAVVCSAQSGAFVLLEEAPQGLLVSEESIVFLQHLDHFSLQNIPACSPHACHEISDIAQRVLGSQLGASSLRASGVCLAISSAATPI